jgi:putative transposase
MLRKPVPAGKEQSIILAERRLGIRLPESVKEWYSKIDGLDVLSKYSNDDWALDPSEFTRFEVCVDGQGGPLAIVVAPANVNDHVLLKETIEAIVVKRPRPTEKQPQHLCLDAGYDNQMSRETVKEHHYQGHIRPARGKGPARKSKKKYPPRRWVVERTFSWLSKCRGLLVRYEKKSKNYLGLLQFACALYWYRRLRTATADSS